MATPAKVTSIAEYRAKREGWEPVSGKLDTTVFQVEDGRFEVRFDDGTEESAWHVNRAWLEQLHAKLGRVLGK